MITIDSEKCTGCKCCVEVCPNFVLRSLSDSGEIDVPYPDYCCACGHCVAVCPVDAVNHKDMPASGFEAIAETNILPDQMRTLLLSRRSIRAFQDKAVSKERLEQLIEAGIHAGTASNAQTEGFIVIQDQDTLAELEQGVIKTLWNGGLKYLGSSLGIKLASMVYGKDMVQELSVYRDLILTLKDSDRLDGMVFRHAPAVIIMHGIRANDQTHANCAIAVRNMEIMATAMGLGTCWVGFLTAAAHMSRTIGTSLGLPKDRSIYGALMVGHPRYSYKRSIPRHPRDVRWV